MLQLKEIVKNYGVGDSIVPALKGVSLNFRESEFVAILGHSGCGKTTMLNIIGGLDRYTSGDLIIDGVSTKNYKDIDWDAYRNIRIGFIFQSYNLISHIDILSNVEMALTLSGVSVSERRARAIQALKDVGLEDQAKKRPNQLSGGQMQRVSIARALINNPHIILADEPTGALDSATSVQIMDLLRDIAKDRLVIMVTHNKELAEEYATRIVSIKDGEIMDDTNPFIIEESLVEDKPVVAESEKIQDKAETKKKKKALAKTSMSFWTAVKLSFTNLMTKKGRTILTAIAGSIGIIGVSLVLAISNGFSLYIDTMQKDMLAGYPIEIAQQSYDYATLMGLMQGSSGSAASGVDESKKFTSDKELSSYDINYIEMFQDAVYFNNLSAEYCTYLSKMDKKWYDSIHYVYGLDMNLVGHISSRKPSMISMQGGTGSDYVKLNSSMLVSVGWNEIVGPQKYIESQYDCLYGSYPTQKNQVMLVVNSSNMISSMTACSLGLDYTKTYSFEDMMTTLNSNKMKVFTNNAYYEAYDYNGATKYRAKTDLESLYKNSTDDGSNETFVELEVVGIYRQKEGLAYTALQEGICYTQELTQYMLENGSNSDIVNAQKNSPNNDVLIEGSKDVFDNEVDSIADIIASLSGSNSNLMDLLSGTAHTYTSAMNKLGGIDKPVYINIYAKSFDMKSNITGYLDAWNTENPNDEVNYNDMAALLASMLSQMIKIITIALTCFSSVSLIVSSFMIGIITYVSVVERTKEIGILRSLGARKKDIARVFNAESGMIGLTAGLIGIIVTYILSLPINLIINHLAGMTLNICALSPLAALCMVLLSVGLTLIAGLIPSSIASKRDPVEALRSE